MPCIDGLASCASATIGTAGGRAARFAPLAVPQALALGIGPIGRLLVRAASRPSRDGTAVDAGTIARCRLVNKTPGIVQNLSQCAGRPATSSRCESDTMKE